MRITKQNIIERMRALTLFFPLPAGYKYSLESNNPGDGRRYSLAIVRNDYQDGDFYDIPRLGSLRTNEFYQLLGGIIESRWLLERIGNLKEVKDA